MFRSFIEFRKSCLITIQHMYICCLRIYIFARKIFNLGSKSKHRKTIFPNFVWFFLSDLWEGIPENPGPNKYAVEKVRMIRERTAPAFTLTSRPKTTKNTTPSPCAYTLPSIMGDRPVNFNSVPFYSMNKRIDYSSYSYDFAKTPGPAGYKVPSLYVTFKQPPGYSLKDRTLVPKFKMDNPGPGTYDLHSAKLSKRTAPKFSMGIKHSPYIMPLCQDIFQ